MESQGFKKIISALFFLLIANGFIWFEIIFNQPNKNPEIYFLDVGQGDSEMVVLPGNVKVLIDGGPDNKILSDFSKVISPYDRYIDLMVLSHPQMDHYGGFIETARRYRIGAFIFNGRDTDARGFQQLKNILKEKNVPIIALKESDEINYLNDKFDVLFPPPDFLDDKDLNNTILTLQFISPDMKAIFTGDIGQNIENYLVSKYDLHSDILKVAHHGSRFSSSPEFLNAVAPKLSVIEVGKNSYGHPAPAVLERLAEINSKIFRTDKNGIVKIFAENNNLKILTQN